MSKIPREAGRSSFDIIDHQKLMDTLPASGVDFVLDFGCGIGNYLFALANHYFEAGNLLGVDLWGEGIDTLNRKARDLGIAQIKGIKASGLNLDFIGDAEVDLLLMATVLHDLAERDEDAAALRETFRVLRQGGTLAVVEYKKVQTMRGPPVSIRISETELLSLVRPFGFTKANTSSLGPQCYISTFRKNQRS